MMAGLEARAARLAARAQRERLTRIAANLRGMFGAAAIETEADRVLVRGKGLVRRWLIDPNLRFLGGLRR